jgi:NAD-reducing hydrogenase small subunit
MSFLDLDERLLELAPLVELCYSPIADAKEFPPVDVALVEGAVVNEEHLEEIRHIRERTKILVALGDCAVTANITAMRNPIPLADVMAASYGTVKPGPDLPRLLRRAVPLRDVVAVDHYLPGCPPDAGQIHDLLRSLLTGEAPRQARRFG